MKVINRFDLDLSPLKASATTRRFSVAGEDGAGFNLEIKNEDGYYYNFITRVFQVVEAGLYNEEITNGAFTGSIVFPNITDNDQYDISLTAQPSTTKHASYSEVRFGDGSLDINSSKGSNSLLLSKVIYQYVDQTLTLSTYSPNSTIELASQVNSAITLSSGSSTAKRSFSIACSVSTAAKCYRIIKQPVAGDLVSFVSAVVGAAPIAISGENIYPTITTAADSTSEGGTTVNGASTGTTVTTHVTSATIATVGDRVLGNAALAATTVTVATVSGANTFTISESISIADDLPLTFSNQVNYRWPITNFVNIVKEGMAVLPATNLKANTSLSAYRDVITIFPDTNKEEVIIKKEVSAISTLAIAPVITKGDISTQEGAVVFSKQQVLVLAGDTVGIGGYGTRHALDVSGYDVVLSDLVITLTPITTTTSSAVSNSTSVPVTSRNGILDDVSTVSGIGINAALADPTVDTGAGAVTGSGTLVLTSAQTLEDGATLTFAGAGQTATIKGNIQVVKAGKANQTLFFDVEKLLSIT